MTAAPTIVLERNKDAKFGFLYNILIDFGGDDVKVPPALQGITEDKLVRIFKGETKHKGTPPKEVTVFTSLCPDEISVTNLKDEYLKHCKRVDEQKPVAIEVERLKTDWESLNCSEIEEDFMIAILSAQYKTRAPVYLVAVGGSGVGKSYTLQAVKHPSLVFDPDRVTSNFWLPGTSDQDKESFAGFDEALGKCLSIDEAAVIFSEKPDDATKIYSQLLSTYGKSIAKVKDPSSETHVYGDDEKNPCSMIICMADGTYQKNFMKLSRTGYRFVAKRYPVDRRTIYVDGRGIIFDGVYMPGIEDPKIRNQQITSHILNTIDKYKEMVEAKAEMIEKISEIASKVVILSSIWWMDDETDGDSPNRLTSILVNISSLRAMLHDRNDVDVSDVEYAEKFVYELIPSRWEIRRFGLYEILVKDGVPMFDVPNGEDSSMTAGDYSESLFYEHAKNIMAHRKAIKAIKDMYNMVTTDGKLNIDWRCFIKKLCATARKRITYRKQYKKKEGKKNFEDVNEEPDEHDTKDIE